MPEQIFRNMSTEERYWQNWDKGKIAELIDMYWKGYEPGWRRGLVKHIKSKLGENVSILDVGCGSGLICEELLAQQVVTPETYYGGDNSIKLLEIAKQRLPQMKFDNLDIFALPFADRSQENVICINVLQHLPYYDEALRELMRVTAKRLYIMTWCAFSDAIAFKNLGEKYENQSFQHNRYGLGNLITFIQKTIDRRYISDIDIHYFGEKNYTIYMIFGEDK